MIYPKKGENVFIAGATDADSSGDITTHPFNIINAYNSDLDIMQFDTMMNKINDCRLGGDSAQFRFIFGDNCADSRLLWMAQTNSNVGYDITEPSRGKLDIWAGLSNNNCNIVWQKRVGSTSLYSNTQYLETTTMVDMIYLQTLYVILLPSNINQYQTDYMIFGW